IGSSGGGALAGNTCSGDHTVFTALGAPFNIAARLQEITKSLGCEATISEEVSVTAGLTSDDLPQREVEIRGRAEPMKVRVVAETKALSALIDSLAAQPDAGKPALVPSI